MALQLHARFHRIFVPQGTLQSSSFCNSVSGKCGLNMGKGAIGCGRGAKGPERKKLYVISSCNVSSPLWDSWAPENNLKAPTLSDIFWPSAGAFAAMAVLGNIDQILALKGVSMTIAPFGAVCAVLFTAPSSPGARLFLLLMFCILFIHLMCVTTSTTTVKLPAINMSQNPAKYNMFVAQIGCAAIGVLAFSIFGPGWVARSTALATALAFMIFTRAVHPPAASLPLLFIDGAKLHRLNFWYTLFPGAAGCIILCLIQELVCYLKENVKF